MNVNNFSSASLTDAPLLNLLQKSPTEMTPEELRAAIAKLREVATSKSTTLSSLNEEAGGKTSRKTKSGKKSNEEEESEMSKVKAGDLASKYLKK